MDYKQKADYSEAAADLRVIAEKYLRSGEYRPSAIHKARREVLHAADMIEGVLDMEAAK